jgi:hypothetical protein
MRMQARTPCASHSLGEWLGDGTLFSLDWGDEVWVPLFQLSPDNLMPCPKARLVAAELTPTFCGWETADWFVQPNHWLSGAMPIELLASDTPAVHNAARADRFIAAG